MNIKNLFRKRKTSNENTVTKYECTKLKILSSCVSRLEEEVALLRKDNTSFLEVMDLMNHTDKMIYEVFKYRKWENLFGYTRDYLMQRFHFYFTSIMTDKCMEELGSHKIYLTDCVGQSIERYYVFNQDGNALTPKELKEEFEAATIGSEGV